MEPNNFYELTGGLTLIVIKNNGTTFDYIRSTGYGGKNMHYFPHWNDVRQFMHPHKCYIILAKVLLNGRKASLKPIGVLMECSESGAREASAEHYREVMTGLWNAEENYAKYFSWCQEYQQEFMQELMRNMDGKKKSVRDHIRKFQ
jgi:hypothetical protein